MWRRVTVHARVLIVPAVVRPEERGAFIDGILVPVAPDIVCVNGARPRSILRTAVAHAAKIISQHSADNLSIIIVPKVVAHGAPPALPFDLHAAIIGRATIVTS